MNRRVMALATGIAVAWAPASFADDREDGGGGGQSIDLNRGPGQHIRIPGSVTPQGGVPEATDFDFTLNGFVPGRNGAVCAVGTLRGGRLSETPAAFPVQIAGRTGTADDCADAAGQGSGGGGGGGFGGNEDQHGALQRPGLNATPAALATAPRTVPLERAPFGGSVGGLLVPAQVPRFCTILVLNIGRIHLAVAGLIVDTQPINVRITGDRTGLLGALLCALLGTP